MKKIAVSLLLLLVFAVTGFAGFVFLARPLKREPLAVNAGATPERLARGEYLGAGCIDCHSKRDFTHYSGPAVPPFGANGMCFDEGIGIPGRVCPPNISSDKETGIGAWTDGEVLRAMREGISRDGHALFPIMPYDDFRNLSDEDALSIVAFLRTLPPVKYTPPARQLAFPLPVVVRFIPKPLEGPVPQPKKDDPMAYGRYLTTFMGCAFCHTTLDDHMTPIPGKEWAGGNEFRGVWGTVRTANLSPHATGMGDKTKDNFIGIFRAFSNVEGEVPKGAPNTVMPWAAYKRVTDEDLGVIYDYIKAQKPVANVVEKFPKP